MKMKISKHGRHSPTTTDGVVVCGVGVGVLVFKYDSSTLVEASAITDPRAS